MASVGVTAWLAKLTAEYVRVTRDISRATKESVEQALALATAADKAAGQVLLTEVRRIQTELGPNHGDLPDLLTGPALVPSVHPWVHSTIPAAARLHPGLVGLFLQLDRCLDNHRALRLDLVGAEGELASAKQWLGTESPAPLTAESLPESLVGDLQRRARHDKAAAMAESLRKKTSLSHRQCSETIDSIVTLLEDQGVALQVPPANNVLLQSGADGRSV